MQITENKDVHGCQFQPDPSMEKLQSRVDRIKHKLIVLSGKGGVGKSTVSVNTALALANAGNKVGLLDIDIHGPSIPGILGIIGQTVEPSDTGLTPVSYSENLKVMSVGFLLPRQDDAVIWRGPLKNSVIKQFLSDVEWGDLDYLIVDAPPGTGDEPLSIAQLMPQGTHGIIVTTPQRVAVTDVRKSVTFCHKLGLKILGVIENMSGFNCPHCGESVNVFSQGGGESMASDFKIPFLGAIPLDPQIMMCGDRADSFLELHSESSAAAAYREILKQFPGCDGAIESKNVAHLTDDMIRFAIPIAQKRLCMHFGHCEEFYFVDADKKTGALINQFFKTPPPHEPGILPGWINECGANYVIAGGMGSRARQLFEQVGVQVITGASAEDPEIIVKQYLNGTLTTGDNVCDH